MWVTMDGVPTKDSDKGYEPTSFLQGFVDASGLGWRHNCCTSILGAETAPHGHTEPREAGSLWSSWPAQMARTGILL